MVLHGVGYGAERSKPDLRLKKDADSVNLNLGFSWFHQNAPGILK
jgi:hypothetical protein